MVNVLKIDELVFHGIVKKKPGEVVKAELSDIPSVLGGRAMTFLEEQVAEALKSGRRIVEDPGASTVPDMVRQHWSGGADLLSSSRDLAVLLQDNQPSQAPAGLLMVANARFNAKQVFVVAKLEHERGAQATQKRDEQGRLQFDMEYLDQLIFTERGRVHKIGSFPITKDPATDRLRGFVVDQQAPAHHVARYFRERFLGCVWTDQPEESTAKFFDAAQHWIDTIDDPNLRSQYQIELISEMQGPSQTLSVPRFAQFRIHEDDRDSFIAHMSQSVSGLETPKSIDFVRSHLANIRYDLESGVVVIAPPERLNDGTVTMETDPDGTSNFLVTDRISKTSGYGTYKS